MSDDVDLFTQQARNLKRSRWLVVGFVAFFAWLGFGGDLIFYLATEPGDREGYRHVFPWFGIVLTLIGAGIARHAWVTGPKKVLWSTGAWELLNPVGDQQTQLVNVVEEVAIASGLPKPRIFLIKDSDPNALATGRDPETACIAVTEGLLETCTRDELQAVIAHEMGHIKNFDTRLMTLLAALVGAVALLHDGVGHGMLRGGGRGLGRILGGRKSKDSGPLVLILLSLWLLSWLLAPIITRLMALAVSRNREYLADAMSAQFTRNPLALASALQKIEHAGHPTHAITHGAAHLCIADPLGRNVTAKQGRLADLLGTHPPMAIRVAKLKAMGYEGRGTAGA